MPPRKRARASAASTPLTEAQPKTPQDTGPATQSQDRTSPQNEDIVNDPWTDDQETQLFKSMIKWKPTGLHKHFRMISIHNNMRSHGFVTPATPHTRIPGIWAKLDQLYDLSALDERENAYAFSNHPDPTDPEEAPELQEFQLPEDEFGEMMWTRRFHGPESERSSSPAMIPTAEDKALYAPGIGLLHELPEEAKKVKEEAAAASTPTPKPTKAGTRSSRAATKGARAKAQAAKDKKAESTHSESGEDEDEEEEEGSGESEEETAPTTRKTARGATKPKPAPRRGRKR